MKNDIHFYTLYTLPVFEMKRLFCIRNILKDY